jgi:PncC family amidohydrolase
MASPQDNEIFPERNAMHTILQLRRAATQKGLDLLKLIDSKATWGKNPSDNRFLQIATTESLTGGLIMSTLVDIPWGGYMKYGGFVVYDTDAKRVFNGVSVDDVYTHKCASEMAIGVLKNSNATIAIAVTGNAMPTNMHANMLGEVFISVAGYDKSNNVIFVTRSINACKETKIVMMQKICRKWFNTIAADVTKFNARSDTGTVSQEIRYYTAFKAYELCMEFIEQFDPQIPDSILERKFENSNSVLGVHSVLPPNKYGLEGITVCMNDQMGETQSCETINGDRKTEKINLYFGGKRKTKIKKNKQKRINKTR